MTVLQIAIKHCPRKQNKGKSRKSRLEPLKRRKRKLRTKISVIQATTPGANSLSKLQEEILSLDKTIKERLVERREEEERKAIDTIKINPRYFYSYAKRFLKSVSTIAPLKRNDGSLTDDNQEKAELLQSQ